MYIISKFHYEFSCDWSPFNRTVCSPLAFGRFTSRETFYSHNVCSNSDFQSGTKLNIDWIKLVIRYIYTNLFISIGIGPQYQYEGDDKLKINLKLSFRSIYRQYQIIGIRWPKHNRHNQSYLPFRKESKSSLDIDKLHSSHAPTNVALKNYEIIFGSGTVGQLMKLLWGFIELYTNAFGPASSSPSPLWFVQISWVFSSFFSYMIKRRLCNWFMTFFSFILSQNFWPRISLSQIVFTISILPQNNSIHSKLWTSSALMAMI